MKVLCWNLSCLKTKSRPLTGPLPELYLRELTRLVEELQGVYLSGIQVGDARRFAVPNPYFKDFPILYNPEILEAYDLVRSEGEGCLSFPGLWIHVPRYKFVKVRFYDGAWKEQTATFGSDDPLSEEGLLAKAIQHEVFHMDGIVLHERAKDAKKRVKFLSKIIKASIQQNKDGRPPKIVEGPLELDSATLPVVQKPTDVADGTSVEPNIGSPAPTTEGIGENPTESKAEGTEACSLASEINK